MKHSTKRVSQFYFSLPRLVAKVCGGNARRAETNAMEAWAGGLIFYLISYVFFAARFIPPGLAHWQTVLLLVALAFFVWLFWLLLLYINSIIIKLLQPCGLFRTLPSRRAQSILLGISTTAMACALLTRGSWIRGIGLFWLLAVAVNLASAFVLALSNEK
jgi:hypothetical protein